MFEATHLIGFGADAASAVPSYSYRTHAEDFTDLTTYTFASQDIGTASATRYVVVTVFGRHTAAFTFSSVTVAGVSATSVVEQANAGSRLGIFIAAVPSGTTGNVVVTASGGIVRCGIGVYALYDLSSSTAITTNSSTASPAALSVNVTPGKILIAAAYTNGGSGNQLTWSGATEDFDVNLEVGTSSSASLLTSTTETPRTVTGAYGTASVQVAVSALFG